MRGTLSFQDLAQGESRAMEAEAGVTGESCRGRGSLALAGEANDGSAGEPLRTSVSHGALAD
jgi:hypothetical protein